jgi:hypothetical protein
LNYKYAAPTALTKMKPAAKISIVLVTAPDLKTAMEHGHRVDNPRSLWIGGG